MIVIRCPYCKEDRVEEELRNGGEADIARADEPDKQSDEAWTDYLYMRANTKGIAYEQWCCVAGCGQWFKAARHTITHEFTEIIPFNEKFNHQRENKK